MEEYSIDPKRAIDGAFGSYYYTPYKSDTDFPENRKKEWRVTLQSEFTFVTAFFAALNDNAYSSCTY